MVFVRSETNHFCNAQKKITRCIPVTYKKLKEPQTVLTIAASICWICLGSIVLSCREIYIPLAQKHVRDCPTKTTVIEVSGDFGVAQIHHLLFLIVCVGLNHMLLIDIEV